MNEILMRMSFLTIDSSIYTGGGDDPIGQSAMKIVRMIGGWGGIAFTLAIMIIALFIVFGSISSRNIGKVWIALFSCIGGAMVFYSAFILAPAIKNIVGG